MTEKEKNRKYMEAKPSYELFKRINYLEIYVLVLTDEITRYKREIKECQNEIKQINIILDGRD